MQVAGDEERLRDEAIYFAHRSAEPTKYKGPSYNTGKFEKSPFQTPTNTTLEIYEEMLHVFQVIYINFLVTIYRSLNIIFFQLKTNYSIFCILDYGTCMHYKVVRTFS
jgi:hypothetical protein